MIYIQKEKKKKSKNKKGSNRIKKNREGEKKDWRPPMVALLLCTIANSGGHGFNPYGLSLRREREMVRIKGEERGRFTTVNPWRWWCFVAVNEGRLCFESFVCLRSQRSRGWEKEGDITFFWKEKELIFLLKIIYFILPTKLQ